MINKLAFSIVKKNIPISKCISILNNLKLTHSFSDNNKKNPFDKFKRTNAPKPQPKQENKQQSQSEQNQKINEKPQQESNNTSQFENQNRTNSQQGKPIAGFNKFKRNTDYQQKLNLSKKNEDKKQSIHQENVQKQSAYKAYQNKAQPENTNKSQSQANPQKKTDTFKPTEQIKLKGFSKFKKVQTPIQKGQQSQKLSPQNQNESQEQSKKKQQSQLNSKTQEEIERQNSYKNTEKKVQQDKEEWQNFLQDQIKKQKQKKQKKEPYEWKNFDFTSRKKQEDFQKNQQKANKQQKPSPFQAPKTPFEAMKMLFFGGIGVYLTSLLLAQIFSSDNYKQIETENMLKFLKQGRIRQTWFLTSVQSLSQQSSRTKKYLCSTLENGQIYKCESNSDFEVEWSKKVNQFNIDQQTFGGTPVIMKVPIVKKDAHVFNTVRSLLSFALLFMFLKSIMSGVSKGKGQMGKGGGLSGLFQNSKSHRFRQTINVKFNDVVGMNKAKQEIVEFIDFLKNPDKYNKLGAKIPRGALLTGPPGTGKTMLAKACAGQSGVPFFTMSGSQFMEMYVGVGAQRVRNLFAEAKQASPAIIFIDEIDAVGKKRASGAGGGGNDQRDNTLNQLLVQMDGFDQTSNVIVFAATNQKEVLDPALTRPGRFDRLIEVQLPDIEGRKEIFMVHLKPIVLDEKFTVDDYAKRLATLTPGFSGADIKNLCNEAAIIAARNDKKFVSMIDFELASERIIGGVQKKSTLITPQTKRTVAYHECGHGVVSWFMQHASPLLKLTIIPRSKGALGFAQYLPNENQVYTRKQLQDQICVILGGRIAEEIFFGKISTGASDDLQKAHKVGKAIVAEYGMGDKLGWLSYSETEYAKQYSHLTEQRIDEQILQIIYQCSIRTRQIINSKKEQIKNLAELLLKQQTIDQRKIQSILGERPFKSSKQYEEYIRQKKKLEQESAQKVLIQTEEKKPQTAAFKTLSLIDRLGMNQKSTKINIIQNS